MLSTAKKLVKHFIPESLLKAGRPYYHGSIALIASYYFGQPSKKLIVIGVTGTKGKTTTVNLIAAILREAGHKVGFASTATYNFDGRPEATLNTFKMSTLSGWTLQKWLAKMLENDCEYAVLEMTSEGLVQNRHAGIYFDAAVFTNLTPEHLDSHGSFENYQRAKGRLFKALSEHPLTPEKLAINPLLKKSIVANIDSPYGQYYLNFKADTRISYGVENDTGSVWPKNISYSFSGITFEIEEVPFKLNLKGRFDLYNALAAIGAISALGFSLEDASKGLATVPVVPGRMEIIAEKPFRVMVDYAHEPTGMQKLYETVKTWSDTKQIIQVLGPTGGGRDMTNKIKLGELAADNTTITIITTDDPYDDDPAIIADIMAKGAMSHGKKLNDNLFVVLDRRQAMAKAFALAQPSDLVLITGKGSEQKMVIAGEEMIDWDDRKIAREELAKLSK